MVKVTAHLNGLGVGNKIGDDFVGITGCPLVGVKMTQKTKEPILVDSVMTHLQRDHLVRKPRVVRAVGT